MGTVIKPTSLIIGTAVEVLYVLRHPRRTFHHAVYEYRRSQVMRELQRSDDKKIHPSMLTKSPAYREQVELRDAERALRMAEKMVSSPQNHSRPRGRR